jgi:16S rRNA (guanine527-N7)-methyltransferase
MIGLPDHVAALRPSLTDGLRRADVRASDDAVTALLGYIALLQKWNRAYNLTAIRTPEGMLSQHLFDCISVLPFVSSGRVLDLGAGAGLPGFVIAILRPDCDVTLLDSVGKKSRFCRHVVQTLSLDNVSVANTRAETFQGRPFQTIVCRAFASLGNAYALGLRLLAEDGAMVAMKGKLDAAELRELQARTASVETHRVHPLWVDGERHIVVATPDQEHHRLTSPLRDVQWPGSEESGPQESGLQESGRSRTMLGAMAT